MKAESIKLKTAVCKWLDKHIDTLLEKSPVANIFKHRIHKGIKEIILGNIDFDMILPFLTDEDGFLNIKDLKNEIIDSIQSMPQYKYEIGGTEVCIGNGKIALTMKDNIISSIFLGGVNQVIFGISDLEDLFNMFE